MPVYNTFQPNTAIGQGIQNLTMALFGGKTPNELSNEQALSEARRASAEASRASAEASRATAAYNNERMLGARQGREAMAGAPRQLAASLFGGEQQGAEFIDAYKNGGFGQTQQLQGPMPDGPALSGTVRQPMPTPSWVTPEGVKRFNLLQQGLALANAAPGNDPAGALEKLISGLYNLNQRDDIMAGRADATRVAQGAFATSGKAPYDNMGGTGTFNLLTGDQSLNDFGKAKVGSEKALAGQRGAAAAEHSASARLKTLQGDAAVLVPARDADGNIIFDADGTGPIRAPLADVGKSVMRGSNALDAIEQRGDQARRTNQEKPVKDGAQPKDANTTKVENEAITAAMTKLADGRELDPDFSTSVAARATQILNDRKSPNYNNGFGAAQQAWRELVGEKGLNDAKAGVPFVKSRYAPPGWKPGAAPPPLPGLTAPAAPAAAAPAAAPATVKKAKTQAEVDAAIAEGNAAIKRGADPAKVKERLKAMGVTLKE